MRLRSSFLISIAIHATVLTYPIAFLTSHGQEFIPIILLELGDGSGEGVARDEHSQGKRDKPAGPRGPARVMKADPISSEKERTTEAKDPTGTHSSSTDLNEGTPLPSALALSRETVGTFYHHGTSSGEASSGTGNTGTGTGAGAGAGRGVGSGAGGAGSRFLQVSYDYNPRPEYPDRARREGKEGTVLVRVLVDEQGRSKMVELSRSSGFEPLDKAASDAIRHWRFSPARYGEKPVESWVTIPIVFRLADPKK